MGLCLYFMYRCEQSIFNGILQAHRESNVNYEQNIQTSKLWPLFSAHRIFFVLQAYSVKHQYGSSEGILVQR